MDFPILPTDQEVSFSFVDIEPLTLDQDRLASWFIEVIARYDYTLDTLSFIFCDDNYLHKMNVEHLDHDTFTDIISFDLSEEESTQIEGECYISIDRVSENAVKFGQPFTRELNRVMIHGLLHLCGLGDKTDKEAEVMRKAEESALALYESA